jgi:NDP-sugar pyrophosphorylase family protein
MNILIPMAGRGERFSNNGFDIPKPLIELEGKTMIELAIKSLNIEGNYIYVTYRYTNKEFNQKLEEILNRITPNCTIIKIDYITEGPASSALLAKKYIDNEEELIITNCDQIMSWDSKNFLEFIKKTDKEGIVVTYNSSTEKNSYVKLNEIGDAIELAEKKVISEFSLNGIHYWKKGKYFVESAEDMISKNIRVNNEFYISMTYNEMIEKKLKVSNYHIINNHHHAVGTPEDLKEYLKNGSK